MPYGVSNQQGCVSDLEVKDILSYFRSCGFSALDTARSYGNSEDRLSKFLLKDDFITTKISPNCSLDGYEDWFDKSLRDSLRSLNVDKIDTLLYHRTSDLLSTSKTFIEDRINTLKNSGCIRNFGVSVYNKNELDSVLSHLDIDFVQLPINLLDRTFLDGDYLSELKKRRIVIEARSVFLQGLLLMRIDEMPSYFSPWFSHFKILDEWIQKSKITRVEACLSFVKSISEIDRVVVGVQSRSELQEIIRVIKLPPVEFFPALGLGDSKLINPGLWKLDQ